MTHNFYPPYLFPQSNIDRLNLWDHSRLSSACALQQYPVEQ